MRVTPHTEMIRRTKLRHSGLEAAHAIRIIFQK